jgi:hypothetical protein
MASLVAAAVCLVLLIYSGVLLKKFTPVYSPVECLNTNKTFSVVTNASGFFVSASVVMDCTNPNPYAVSIAKGSPGRVFLHPDMINIGEVVTEPYSLGAGGSGEMTADIWLAIPPTTLPMLLSGPKNILEEMHIDATAHLHILGIPIDHEFRETNTCGFSMQVVVPDYKTGPAMCATAQEELLKIIPNVTASPTPFQIGLSEDRLEGFELMRDAGLGSAMALFIILALVSLGVAFLSLRRRSCLNEPQREDTAKAKVDSVEAEAVVEPSPVLDSGEPNKV